MRINRFLAAAGLGSRRSCEELIKAGAVTINGKLCENLATEVTEEDFVKVGSKRVQPEKHHYILLHKPRGYLCTVTDTHDRKTIFDLLPGHWPRLFHVGRLDRDSEGLIILTNDGDLALHLTHPRFKIEKEYEVLLDRHYDGLKDTPKLLKGVNTEHGRARADHVRQIGPNLLRITLRQGLKRQIRLMLYKVGYEVERLVRMRIGPLRLVECLRVGEVAAIDPGAGGENRSRTERRVQQGVAGEKNARGGEGTEIRRRRKPRRRKPRLGCKARRRKPAPRERSQAPGRFTPGTRRRASVARIQEASAVAGKIPAWAEEVTALEWAFDRAEGFRRWTLYRAAGFFRFNSQRRTAAMMSFALTEPGDFLRRILP